MDVLQILAGGILLLMTIAAVLSWKSVGKRAAPLALAAAIPYFWFVGGFPEGLRLVAIGVGVVGSLILLTIFGLLRPLRWVLLTGIATMVLLLAWEFLNPIHDTIRNTFAALTAITAIAFVVLSVGCVVKEAKYHLANR